MLTQQHIARTTETLAFLDGVRAKVSWTAAERAAIAEVRRMVEQAADTLAGHMPAAPQERTP